MIKAVHFRNFKALLDATLPLNKFTLIVGPNGSGKSTAVRGLRAAYNPNSVHFLDVVSASLKTIDNVTVEVNIEWNVDDSIVTGRSGWQYTSHYFRQFGLDLEPTGLPDDVVANLTTALSRLQIYSFAADKLADAVQLLPNAKLEETGYNLAGVLDNLRDSEPERFETLNEELKRWLPEFDRILFTTPKPGQRSLLLRTRAGHRIEARDLSDGTLFALAFLTLAYIPNPPSIVCFEEPERGIHPRLLREVRDAMYRLCYPEQYGDKRKPVQVIATTHSPYFLDLYKDHPEEVVISHKDERGVHFERLSDKPDIDEFLKDAPLGEVWYSGILGGVPSNL